MMNLGTVGAIAQQAVKNKNVNVQTTNQTVTKIVLACVVKAVVVGAGSVEIVVSTVDVLSTT